MQHIYWRNDFYGRENPGWLFCRIIRSSYYIHENKERYKATGIYIRLPVVWPWNELVWLSDRPKGAITTNRGHQSDALSCLACAHSRRKESWAHPGRSVSGAQHHIRRVQCGWIDPSQGYSIEWPYWARSSRTVSNSPFPAAWIRQTHSNALPRIDELSSKNMCVELDHQLFKIVGSAWSRTHTPHHITDILLCLLASVNILQQTNGPLYGLSP